MLHNNAATNNWQHMPLQQQHQQSQQHTQQHHQQPQLASKLFQQQPQNPTATITPTGNQTWQQTQQHPAVVSSSPTPPQQQMHYNNYFTSTEQQTQPQIQHHATNQQYYQQQQQQQLQMQQQQQHPHASNNYYQQTLKQATPQQQQQYYQQQIQQSQQATHMKNAHDNLENNNVSTIDGWDDWEWNDGANINAESTTIETVTTSVANDLQSQPQQHQQHLPEEQVASYNAGTLLEESFSVDDGNADWSWSQLHGGSAAQVTVAVSQHQQQYQQPNQLPQTLSFTTTTTNLSNIYINHRASNIPEIDTNAKSIENAVAIGTTSPVPAATTAVAATAATETSLAMLPPPLPQQQVKNTYNLEIGMLDNTLIPPAAFQNAAAAAAAASSSLSSATRALPLPSSGDTTAAHGTSLGQPVAAPATTTAGNPFKRTGPAQHRRATGLPSTKMTAAMAPLPPDLQGNDGNIALPQAPAPANFAGVSFASQSIYGLLQPENSEILHDNEEVFHATGEAVALAPAHPPAPPNDERAQYLQTSHLSEQPDGEAQLETDSLLPPPGLSRLVPLGQPELVETQQRLVTGTEQPSSSIAIGHANALHIEERHADGEDTSDEQSPTVISSISSMSSNNSNNLHITRDRNLYLVAGESNGNEQRVVTGVETANVAGIGVCTGISAGVNVGLSPIVAETSATTVISEQREIVLDGENLEDQQQSAALATKTSTFTGQISNAGITACLGIAKVTSKSALAVTQTPQLMTANHSIGTSTKPNLNETNDQKLNVIATAAPSSNSIAASKQEQHYHQHSYQHTLSNISTGNEEIEPYQRSQGQQTQQQQGNSSQSHRTRERNRNSDRFESEESGEFVALHDDRDRLHNRQRSHDGDSGRRYSDADERNDDREHRWRQSGRENDKTSYDYYSRSGKDRRGVSSRQYRHYADDDAEDVARQGDSGGAGSGPDGRRSKASDSRRTNDDTDYDVYREREQRERGYHRRRRGDRDGEHDRDREQYHRSDGRTRRGDRYANAYGNGYHRRPEPAPAAHYRNEIEYKVYQRRAREERETRAVYLAANNSRVLECNSKMRHPYDANVYPPRLYEKIIRNPKLYNDLCTKFYNELESMPSPRDDKTLTHERVVAHDINASGLAVAGEGHDLRQTVAAGIVDPAAPLSHTDGRESRQSGRSSIANNEKERSGLKAYAPTTTRWPLKFTEPHTFVNFCVDKFMTIEPSRTARGVVSHPMKLYKLSEQSGGHIHYGSYPGPLVANVSFTEKIIAYCEEQMRLGPRTSNASIYAKPTAKGASVEMDMEKCRASHKLLWNLLIQMMRQKGRIDGTDVANLLSKNEEEFPYEPATANDAQTTTAQAIAPPMPVPVLTTAQTTDKFRKLLIVGNKSDALDWAAEHQLWGHALYIASRMDNRAHASVLKQFALSNVANNDPLLTLYQVLSNHTPTSVTSLHNEKWGDWRPHFAMVITNTAHNPELGCKAIAILGDSLFQRGDIYAAHFAYILANVNFTQHDASALEESSFKPHLPKLVLLGSSHYKQLSKFATDEAIIMTEVYEYARSLNEHNYSIVSLQYYKYLLAIRLLDAGYSAKCLLYLEQIGLHIQRDPSKYTRTFIQKICNLADQLRYNDPLLQKPLDETRLSYNSALNYVEQAWLSSLRLIYEQYEHRHNSNHMPSAALPAGTNPAQIHKEFVELNKQFDALNMQYIDNNSAETQQRPLPANEQPQAQSQSQYFDHQPHAAGTDAVTYAQPTQQQHNSQYTPGDVTAYGQQYEQQQGGGYYDQTQPQQIDAGATDSYDYWATQQQQFDGDENAMHAAQPSISLPRSKTYESDEDNVSNCGDNRKPTKTAAVAVGGKQQPQDNVNRKDSTTGAQLGGNSSGGGGGQQNSGWLNGIWSKITLKPKNQMILPDDKNPSIVWDPDKQRWVNKDGDESEEHSLRPPPKMADLMAAGGGIVLPSVDMKQQQQQPKGYMQPMTAAATPAPDSNYNYGNEQLPASIPTNVPQVAGTDINAATPKLQSNAFKTQRYRKLKNSYVDVFNPSGAPLKNTAENVMAPVMPPLGVPQGGFLVPGAPMQQQQPQQQPQDGFY